MQLSSENCISFLYNSLYGDNEFFGIRLMINGGFIKSLSWTSCYCTASSAIKITNNVKEKIEFMRKMLKTCQKIQAVRLQSFMRDLRSEGFNNKKLLQLNQSVERVIGLELSKEENKGWALRTSGVVGQICRGLVLVLIKKMNKKFIIS